MESREGAGAGQDSTFDESSLNRHERCSVQAEASGGESTALGRMW